MKKNNVPKARKDNLVVQDLNGETLIYDLDTNRAVCLNETSALVWQNCDGVKTVSDISSVLSAETNNSASEDLVWLALDMLNKENLIENSAEIELKFESVSRREVIKKIGLGTMIALPFVSSMVAPVPANAQSACVMMGGTVSATGSNTNQCQMRLENQCCDGTVSNVSIMSVNGNVSCTGTC